MSPCRLLPVQEIPEVAGRQEADRIHHKGGVPLTAPASLELNGAAASINVASLAPVCHPAPILVGCTEASCPCHIDQG